MVQLTLLGLVENLPLMPKMSSVRAIENPTKSNLMQPNVSVPWHDRESMPAVVYLLAVRIRSMIIKRKRCARERFSLCCEDFQVKKSIFIQSLFQQCRPWGSCHIVQSISGKGPIVPTNATVLAFIVSNYWDCHATNKRLRIADSRNSSIFRSWLMLTTFFLSKCLVTIVRMPHTNF